MDDELRKPIKVVKSAPDIQPVTPEIPKSKVLSKTKASRARTKLLMRKRFLLPLIILIVLVAGTLTYFGMHKSGLPNLLPKNVQKTLSFNLYYPNPAKLPVGYTLNSKSFLSNTSPGSLAIVYTVNYGDGQSITFSIQKEPSASAIQTFYNNHLALHTTHQTSVGTATIGAISLSQTLASLPTNTNAWLLVTAPSNINQTKLVQVVDAIELAN